MPFTDVQLTNARQLLGLAADADEVAVMAALAAPPATAPTEPADPATPPTPDPAEPPAPPASIAASGKLLPGTFVIDQASYESLKVQAARGDEAYKVMAADARDRAIEAAVVDGKIAPARVAHWKSAWNHDPEGAKQALASMPKGLIPIAATGYAGGLEDDADDEFASLFPPTQKVSS